MLGLSSRAALADSGASLHDAPSFCVPSTRSSAKMAVSSPSASKSSSPATVSRALRAATCSSVALCCAMLVGAATAPHVRAGLGSAALCVLAVAEAGSSPDGGGSDAVRAQLSSCSRASRELFSRSDRPLESDSSCSGRTARDSLCAGVSSAERNGARHSNAP
eukprot:6895274-Prymnesium_polylepis.1